LVEYDRVVSGSNAPVLTLDRYAAVTALIDAGTPRDQVLAVIEMTPADWTGEQTLWLLEMARQARLKRTGLQNRFNTSLLDKLTLLEEGEAVEVADGVSLHLSTFGAGKVINKATKPSAAPAASEPPLVAPAAVAPAAVAPAAVAPAAVAPAAVAPAVVAPAVVAPAAVAPAAVAPAAVAPAAAPPSSAPLSSAPLSSTADSPAGEVGDGVLPFAASPAAGPRAQPLTPKEAAAALPFRPTASSAGVSGPPASGSKPPADTIPDAPPAASIQVLPFTSQSATPPPAGRVLVSDPVRSGETYDDPPPGRKFATLPFRRPAVASQPSRPVDQGSDGALPFQKKAATPRAAASAPRPQVNLGATMATDGPMGPVGLPFSGTPAKRRAAASDNAALPFRGPGEAQPARKKVKAIAMPEVQPDPLAGTMVVPPSDGAACETKLTLEQFASLGAEVALNADDAAAIKQRYGLDAASYGLEQRAWARRFLDDPALAARFQHKLTEFKRWLSDR